MFGNKLFRRVLIVVASLLVIATVISLMIFYVLGNKYEETDDATVNQYKYHFAMICNRDDRWNEIYQSAKDYAEKNDAYVDLITDHLSDEYSKENLLDIAINSGVDGIILEGDGSERIFELIDKAKENDIPVVTVMTDATGSFRDSYVGVNSFDVGMMFARETVELLKDSESDEKRIMVLMNDSEEYSEQLTMYQTIVEELSGRTASIEVSLLDNNSQFSTDEEIRDIIIGMDYEPDVVLCLSEDITDSLYQGLIEYAKTGINVLGMSSSQSAAKAVDKGFLKGYIAVDNKMMGSHCTEALLEIKNTGYVNDYYMVDAELVTANNVKEYIKDEKEQ